MIKQKLKLSLSIIATSLYLLSACYPGINLSVIHLPATSPTYTPRATRITPLSPTVKPSLIPSRTPGMTHTPSATETPAFNTTFFGPGEVSIPVLLYHHVLLENPKNSRYAVDLKQFTAELEYLKNEGYQTINVAELVKAVTDGSYLPVKPIIITFDDGNRDVYENAFPVLNSMGFSATVYLISAETGFQGRLKKEMIQEMAAAGWEFGSHSMTHADLRKTNNEIDEVCKSRTVLAKELGVKIETFAYPFGVTDDRIKQLVRDCGYTSGAGLGLWVTQSASDIFYFNRREVEGNITLDDFASLLVNSQ